MLAYGERPVVALLDSTRVGEQQNGVPIVGSSTTRSASSRPPPSSASPPRAVASRPPGVRLRNAISNGLHVENGLHEFLAGDEELSALADRHGVELRDLRRPPEGLNVPTGATSRPVRTVLTVGSDCAIGKMTVSLELDRAAQARGLASRFVPTGQTGIAIAGGGIAVDAVVSDFLAGATEQLVVEGHERGGELLMVEGRGSLIHPAYSGVTLGCCTVPRRTRSSSATWPGSERSRAIWGTRSLRCELVDLHERMSPAHAPRWPRSR